ncbi:MAG: FxLYD domain-containing protein [Bryobacteraceae bacterium]
MANPLGTIFRPLWLRLDKLLSGRAQDDPLFLSNRTVTQKMKSWLAIGVPCLLVIGVVAFALSRRGGAKDVRAGDLTPEQVAAKMLPDYSKTLDLGTAHPVTVDEVQVRHSEPPQLVGVVRNNSGHVVDSADLVCELETRRGSRLGAVTAHVGAIAPHATARFEVDIAQDTASIAIVSEIRVH